MFPTKLFSYNNLPSVSSNQHWICSDCITNIKNIINDLDYTLFINNNLTYDEQMFLLNRRDTIEGHLIDLIIERIQNEIPNNNIHRICLANVIQFSRNFILLYHIPNLNPPIASDHDNMINIVNDNNDQPMLDFLIDDPNPREIPDIVEFEYMLTDEFDLANYINLTLDTITDNLDDIDNMSDDNTCVSSSTCSFFNDDESNFDSDFNIDD